MERAKALGKEGEKWIPLMKREFAESSSSWNKKKQRGTSVGLGLLYDGLVSHPGEVAILLPQQKSR